MQLTVLILEFKKQDFDSSYTGMARQLAAYSILMALLYSFLVFYELMNNESAFLHQKDVQLRIGSLYQGMDASRTDLKYYSTAFFAIRIVFVAVTFALYS